MKSANFEVEKIFPKMEPETAGTAEMGSG